MILPLAGHGFRVLARKFGGPPSRDLDLRTYVPLIRVATLIPSEACSIALKSGGLT